MDSPTSWDGFQSLFSLHIFYLSLFPYSYTGLRTWCGPTSERTCITYLQKWDFGLGTWWTKFGSTHPRIIMGGQTRILNQRVGLSGDTLTKCMIIIARLYHGNCCHAWDRVLVKPTFNFCDKFTNNFTLPSICLFL